MSRVVRDQKEKFETNELFRKLRKEFQVRYAGVKDKSPNDRCAALLEDCKNRQLEIALVGCGLTLTLLFKHAVFHQSHGLLSNFVEVDLNGSLIKMVNPFIFNGVCVIFRGWLDIDSLEGKGQLEFDSEAARDEEQKLFTLPQPDLPNHVELPYQPQMGSLSISTDSLHLPSPVCLYDRILPEHFRDLSAFLGASISPKVPPNPSPPAERRETPDPTFSHLEPHWKKRIRQNSDSTNEPANLSMTRDPGLYSFNFAASSNFVAREERFEDDDEEAALDLSKNSKTHPPSKNVTHPSSNSMTHPLSIPANLSISMMHPLSTSMNHPSPISMTHRSSVPMTHPPSSNMTRPSEFSSSESREMDETLSSFNNMWSRRESIQDPSKTPPSTPKSPGLVLLPKKKYSRMSLEDLGFQTCESGKASPATTSASEKFEHVANDSSSEGKSNRK